MAEAGESTGRAIHRADDAPGARGEAASLAPLDSAAQPSAAGQPNWERVRARLRQEVGDAVFATWLNPLRLNRLEADEVRLAVPTRFMRDWVATHYGERLRTLWQGEVPSLRSIGFDVTSGDAPPAPPTHRNGATAAPPAAALARATPAQPAAPLPAEDDLSAGLDVTYTFDNFVVGKPNEFAHAAALRVADSGVVSFNPLFLYGGVGLGKTHLMHAVAWRIRERFPERRVAYLSAEKFMYSFVRALRYKDTINFKEQFRSVDVLMIDDVQFISGKDSTQEEFFHTFNALVDQGRQIIISADKSPNQLEDIGERLRSRLASGLVADIHPTTYELRLGILQSKADQLGARVPPKVMEFLAHKMNTNGRELEGALTRLWAHAQLIGRPLNLETAQDVLGDLLRAYDRRVTIEEIQKKVAEYHQIKVADMSSARRARAIARPRQVAMYLAKQLTSRSLPEIGRKFGGRDHTTVMHAVKTIENLIQTDPNFAEDVDLLRRMLET
ncbi:chromosomal replication initiator protein DnaA [Roseospirillum parvum]|uniref:Chromosomal replication initiator protein DnaA n=1 Tax=Roseospirillum parvum TaxID=83401 RepID=A0A1G7ZVI9_9PROT|nr:chromosomal replication initiator protein DnaA [Roseospirillum parvum]SDH12674.1 chromosomal replication initiator protein [Roseospirillum parvum]